MRYNEFTEARKNPELNPKTSINAVIQDYLNQAEKLPGTSISNLFVSFTKLPKLGINPKSEYSTPNGIYAYPADYIVSRTNQTQTMNKLPFAGASPWANIFRVNPNANIIVLQNVTKAMLENYIERIKKELLPELGIEDNRYGFGKMLRDVEMESSSKGQILWAIIGRVGQSMSENEPVGMNAAYRRLGIDGVIDLGAGIIHSAEPTQAVFFKGTSDVIELLDRVANKYSPDLMSTRKDFGQKYAELSKTTINYINSVVKNYSPQEAARRIANLAHSDISYLLYSPKNIRLEILKNNPTFLKRLASARVTRKLDRDEVLAAINNDPTRYKEFQQINLRKNLSKVDLDYLKSKGYDFTILPWDLLKL